MNKLIEEAQTNKDYQDIYIYAKKHNVSSEKIALVIYDLITQNNLRKASKLYKIFLKPDEKLNKKYRFLRNIITEKQKYEKLRPNRKKAYDKCLQMGKEALKRKDYYTAYDYFTSGKFITENPIFDYYTAKALHYAGNYKEAYNCFKYYASHGGQKITQSLLYILGEVENREDPERFKRIYNRIIEIDSIIDPTFDLENRIYPRELPKVSTYGAAYDDYTLIEKLSFIKYHIQSHNTKYANKLIQKLYNNSDDAQQLIRQFERNKKLYKNQNLIYKRTN